MKHPEAKPLAETSLALSMEQLSVLRDLQIVVAPQLAGLQENAEALDVALEVLRWALRQVEQLQEAKRERYILAE